MDAWYMRPRPYPAADGKVTVMRETGDTSSTGPASDEPEQVLVAAAAMDESDGEPVTVTDADGPEEVLLTAQRIDEFFAKAGREQAARYGDRASVIQEMLRHTDQFTAVNFVEAYWSGQVYPEDRLRELDSPFHGRATAGMVYPIRCRHIERKVLRTHSL
jgi:hypothetical protein